mgnify:CR=1 FL=1
MEVNEESLQIITDTNLIRIQEQTYFLSRRRLLSEGEEDPDDIHYVYRPDGIDFEDDTDSNDTVAGKLAEFGPNRRSLQYSGAATIMNIQIIAIPDNRYYPSPRAIAQSLENKTDQLAARLPNFDKTYPINAYEFISYVPKFVETPLLTGVGETWGSFSAKLDKVGFLFAVAIPLNSNQSAPSPYQIWQGYDMFNIPQPAVSVEVSQYYKTYHFNITGLVPLTDYYCYIVGGSVHPGYPDLMAPNKIESVKFRTEPSIISNFCS